MQATAAAFLACPLPWPHRGADGAAPVRGGVSPLPPRLWQGPRCSMSLSIGAGADGDRGFSYHDMEW